MDLKVSGSGCLVGGFFPGGILGGWCWEGGGGGGQGLVFPPFCEDDGVIFMRSLEVSLEGWLALREDFEGGWWLPFGRGVWDASDPVEKGVGSSSILCWVLAFLLLGSSVSESDCSLFFDVFSFVFCCVLGSGFIGGLGFVFWFDSTWSVSWGLFISCKFLFCLGLLSSFSLSLLAYVIFGSIWFLRTLFLASLYPSFSLVCMAIIYFSSLKKKHFLSFDGCGSPQLAQLRGFWQALPECPLSPHLLQTSAGDLHALELWLYRWHLKHCRGLGKYFLTSKQVKPILTSSGISHPSKVRIMTPVFSWFPLFFLFILYISLTLYRFSSSKRVLSSSSTNRLHLMVPLV